MAALEEQIHQCQAAIAAQESLRSTLGDVVVDVTVAALRSRIEALQSQLQGPTRASRSDELLELLQGYLPRELADKMRAFGRIDGERKQVTVLFADLSGFTALSERLDAEEVAEITHAVLKELAGAVYEFEGYIDKFIGDAIMAVFGAPIAHENDPDRALRVALSMRERLEGFNRHWRDRVGEPLTLHIGINTGMVIAGNIGSDMRLSYTVMGDTVNTASRLESAARPGQILVSHNTYRLTLDSFAFVALEPLQIKGKREPLVVYELDHARLTPSKSRGLKGFRTVFVERERELALLAALAERLQSGSGHVLVVTGEAGIGKSRLMAGWRAALPPALRWLEGRSFPHTGTLPYGPFLDLFLRYAGIGDDDLEEQARQRLRVIVERFFPANLEAQALFASMLALHPTAEEEALLAALPAEGRRRRLFALVRQWLVELAVERPVVLVFEDMHWIDTTSIELIQSLLPLVETHPVIVAGVFRGARDEVMHSFHTVVTAHYGERSTLLPLAALSEQGSAAMVRELLQVTTLSEPVRLAVLHKAEGNPFFIEEVLRMLVERGALVRAAGGDAWVPSDLLDQVSIPDTLHGVLMARIDRLYPETRWIVQQASVIGRVFLYRVLSRVASSDHLGVDIELLEREGLILERSCQPEVEYMFKHALTQEVAYQSLLGPRRKELHSKVGEVMEVVFADRLAEFYSVVGRHFLLGEQWAKATDYLARSAAAAARLYAHVEARTHYREALKALEHLPPDDRIDRAVIDLTIGLARVSQVADEPAINLTRLQRAEERVGHLFARSGLAEDRLRLARVLLFQALSYMMRGDAVAAATACFQRVLPVAQEFQDEELLVAPSTNIGKILVINGRFQDAIPLFRRVIEPLARWDDLTEWILTLVFLGLAEVALGRRQEGERLAQQALARAVETHNNTGQIYAHMFLAAIAVHTGDMRRVLIESQQTWKLADASGDRLYCYFSHGYQALAHSRLGDHAAAAENLTRQREMAASLGRNLVTADWFAAMEAEVAFNAGRFDAALALARAAIEEAVAMDGIYSEGFARRVCGQALAATGAPRSAIDEQFAASVECFDRGGAALESARTHALWREVHAGGGNGASEP